jgi:Holliday junction resolvase RusA-like endonuclease
MKNKPYILTFTAPTKPLSINESNRLHWAVRRKRLKDWHNLAIIAYKNMKKEDKEELKKYKIKIKVILTFPKNARRDPHNYIGTNVKAIIDGLIKAGLTEDDTQKYIEVIDPYITINDTNEVIILLYKGAKLK